jgi:heme A synthase
MKLNGFAKFSWGVLAFNLGVILWGAFVRATGSGAGCGNHWPTCQGEIIPRAPEIETIIEFTHRLTSGMAFLLVLGMMIWAFKAYEKGHLVRMAAAFAMVFMVTEALVGAGLVLFELVGENTSIERAVWMAAHLANTFILLAFISLTAWWASQEQDAPMQSSGLFRGLFGIGVLGMLVLGASGAVTALGDTLFPASDIGEVIRREYSTTGNILVRLRILHPTIAILVSVYLIIFSSYIRRFVHKPFTFSFSLALTWLLVLQLGIGFLNVLLLAPVWMQLVHLLISDAIWIVLILLGAAALSVERGVVAERKLSPPVALEHKTPTT